MTLTQASSPNGAVTANLLCMASMVVWAAALPAADFLIGHVPPVSLTMLRMGLAGLCLLPVWWLAEGSEALRRAPWLRGIGIGALFSLGALCLVLAQARTDVVTVAVIASLLPVIGMSIEVALDGRRVTLALVVGIALSLAGALAYAAKIDQFGLGLGAAAALVSNIAYAAGSRLSVTALPGMTALGRSALGLSGAGIAAAVAAGLQAVTVGTGEWGSFGWTQAGALVMFSVFGMAICQLLWIASMDKLGLGLSALHINAASFYVMFFAWLLGAAWNWTQAAGAVIVGLGVLVAQGVIPLGPRHAPADLPALSQSPTDPAFVQDPYPFYERARALGPFFHWTDYGLICTPSQAAVSAIFRDRRFGRETPAELASPVPPHLAPFYAVEAHSMLELEPPRHSRLRGLVLRAFTSRRIAELAPEITQLTHALIDGFPATGPFDLLTHLGQPLPVTVIARLLGVPAEMGPDLLRWSNAMVAMYQAGRTRQTEEAAAAATESFVAFLRAYVEQRRARPADDLITSLIAAEMEGDKLTTDELISTCILLLNAGHEATVHTIGNGVKTLLATATAATALGPDRIEATVEEILRFEPPLHMFTRWAYEPVEVMGRHFDRGDQVALLLAAANRDPGAWDRPALFLPARPARPNASFGAGLHFCIGAPLARLELQIALPILFSRCPGLRLAAPPVYADVYHFHGLTRLMVSRD